LTHKRFNLYLEPVMVHKQIYAVVMGDIVRSEKAPSTEWLHTKFNEIVDLGNRNHHMVLVSPLTITLGDEFQGLAQSLSATLPLVRDLRLGLLEHEIACRFAIGLVELRTPLNAEKAWNMMGPGLARTREKLAEKRAASLYRFAVTEDPVFEGLLDAVGAGLTSIERRWTRKQRDHVKATLDGANADDLAQHQNVSSSNIYKILRSANFETYAVQWDAIAKALGAIDAAAGMP
jgi:SatD family (SatD)